MLVFCSQSKCNSINGSRWVICISKVDVANHYLEILINHVFHFRSGNKAERQKRLFYPKKWIKYFMRAVIVSFPKSKNEMIYQAKGVIYLKKDEYYYFLGTSVLSQSDIFLCGMRKCKDLIDTIFPLSSKLRHPSNTY